ncbi:MULTISPECIES: glucosyl-dolichyl phosphate glucuronosyltransferase [unclassified Haloferax]|uniref:glucosyl-dolichyl phosphate glucuronosyltransferase n=1 Tax=unclassified Haloferax TaxID=2625095 RepID=UPI0028753B58|nr:MULTISPECIES: glucosyl-dolichyl phosphate glucuronosyltransferase [unclassified Haloferax]MDS0239872.1 glycosyltransferase [Haloferax sp. S2CR25]MDS0442993.1 glycosyltransferase [Haloferax sp. S2CR25-2]
MEVSVVVCTYSMERYESFSETVESVLEQTYEPLEIVIVVDGNEEMFVRVQDDFGDIDGIVLHCNDQNQGISYSRTKGAEIASGEIVAMIDDDATAEPDWIEKFVQTYEEYPEAVAVGGHVIPDWVAQKPDFFPEEFYWLVGCDERGFGEHMEEVRNTYGSNISFKRDIFLEVGGYDTNTGRKGDKHVQAHEAPVCIRIHEQTGKRVIYNKEARVNHKLFEYRTKFDWLVFRSFWQGYSKRVMDLLYPQASDDKNEYLKDLMLVYVVNRLKNLVKEPSMAKAQQLIAIFVFTAAVGFGYVYGLLTPNLVEKTNA